MPHPTPQSDSGPLTIDAALARAIACHRAGQLPDAERLYRAILQAQPRHPDANHNLGILFAGAGNPAAGLPFLKTALEANPQSQDFWVSYLNAFLAVGSLDSNSNRLNEAEKLAREMSERFPEHGLGWHVLAAILHLRGRNEEALSPAQTAVARCEQAPEMHNTLGAILKGLGRFEEAEVSCRRALKINPAYPEAHSNLGATLKCLNRWEEAERHCRRALELRPDYAEALLNLGASLQSLGRLGEAESVYVQLLKTRPDSAEGYIGLGSTLTALGRPAEAEQCCRRAIALNANLPAAHIELGSALRRLGRLKESVQSFEHALRFKSGFDAIALTNLGAALQELGRVDEALTSYENALRADPGNPRVGSNLLLCLNYLPGISAAAVLKAHKQWATRQSRPVLGKQHPNPKDPQRRLRVGYVSGDLKRHSVAYFFEPLLRAHDRSVVEVYCYAEVQRPDDVTARLQSLTDHWATTIGVSDQALAERIRNDRIDILVDLAGHTAKNRLPVFALKPAPIQVSWLGYPNTTGLPTIDYRLVDEITDPAGTADANATERLIRLPKGFLCYAAPASAPSPSLRPGASGAAITFGSFNNPTKLSNPTLDAWATVLKRTPGSRLLLKGKPFDDPLSREEFLARFKAHGIDHSRLTLLGHAPRLADHLAEYAQIDIALDPFPYNGTTTTCEALWMGVPVVSLLGDRHAGRVGASLLSQVGLKELVATSADDYIDIAVNLAGDPNRLAEHRQTLRKRMSQSPLCDAAGFARKTEQAFRQMWQTYCAQPTRGQEQVRPKTGTWRPTQKEKDFVEGLFRNGKYHELAQVAQKLTEHFPNDGFGWKALAVSLSRCGRNREALRPAQKAVELLPGAAEAHNNLGTVVQELGLAKEAEASFRRALALEPGQALAHSNLAGALRVLGRLNESLVSARRAIELNPNMADAHVNEGLALVGLRRLHEAEASFQRSLSLEPNHAIALSNLGGTFHELGRYREAEASFRRALAIAPNYAIGHNNLALILRAQGKLEEAVTSYRRAIALDPSYSTARSNLLLTLNYIAGISARELYAEHQRWGELHAQDDSAIARRLPNKDPQRRLRVGYVSPDLRQHSVAYFFEPLLREHDRSAVEIFCYAGVQQVDETSIRLKAKADHWAVTVGLSDREMAQRIADDQIDILVDLAGHTAKTRLPVFAFKPAPIQVSWLGYPNTTGLRTMDYRLVDEITDPPGPADEFSTERLVRLPRGFLCYLPPAISPPAVNPPRPVGDVAVFGSFNVPTKLSSATLATWAEIIKQVPGSRLLLKGPLFGEPENRSAFLDRLQGHGIDPTRVDLRGWTKDHEEHFALYDQMDIALDPFPYNGTTTTCEALWMGVPVVTLLGDRHAARVGASLLAQVGVNELVADSVDSYVDIAVRLASDRPRLTQYHQSLRDRMAKSSLCDAPAFARKVETAFRQMWQTYCAS